MQGRVVDISLNDLPSESRILDKSEVTNSVPRPNEVIVNIGDEPSEHFDYSRDAINSNIMKKRDRVILYADQKDEQREDKGARNQHSPL